MVYDEQLAERVRELTGAAEAVTELRMFGGWCITLHGNLAVGVAGDDLIVRVGPDAYDAALTRPGVRPFDITGRAIARLGVRRRRDRPHVTRLTDG